jgi:hypothetical protein
MNDRALREQRRWLAIESWLHQDTGDAPDPFSCVRLPPRSASEDSMRWRFIDPRNRSEAAERGETITKIDSWWNEFQEKSDQVQALFSRRSHWDLAAWMEAHLQAIDPRLMWEFGPAVHGSGHRLVITPESYHHLRPLVARILELAPAIEGWESYEHRLPEDTASALLTVEGRTGGDIRDFKVRVERGEHHRIHLCYCSPFVSDANDQNAFNAAFVATETLLGEECLNKWIGAVGVFEDTPPPPMSPFDA